MLPTTPPARTHAPRLISDSPKGPIPSSGGQPVCPAANARWYAPCHPYSRIRSSAYRVRRSPLAGRFLQKCDGSKPVCQQCTKANRAADCEYDDGKSKTRTQLLQEKIQRLESRIHQLEGAPSAQQQSTNPGGPVPYSNSAAGNLVDVSLHSSSLGYATGHPNPISVYGSPRNTPSPPNRQTYFDENIFSATAPPPQQFAGDVFLDPASADPLSLGEPPLPFFLSFSFIRPQMRLFLATPLSCHAPSFQSHCRGWALTTLFRSFVPSEWRQRHLERGAA